MSKSVALYARVSSEQQTQQATIDSQLTALRSRAQTDGHHVTPDAVYMDEGFSGATLVRPALERLRDRIAEGGLDLLYVHSPDRLARRYAYQVVLLEEFSARGVSVIFLNRPSGETPEDTLLLQVQGMIAEYERAKIMERCRRGKLHHARKGTVNPLSGAPYGYRYIRKTDTEPARYEIVSEEAAIVREVFDALVLRQASMGDIVRTLNANQVPTRRGAPRWDRSTVWAMLRNPAYIGKAAYGKTEVIERGTLLRPIRNRSIVPRHSKSAHRDRPADQWIYIPVPAIVTPEIFAAASEQLSRNLHASQLRARGKRYLLQGLVVCARCGYAFYGKPLSRASIKGDRHYAYYRCLGTDSYRFAGGAVCHNPQVRVDQLDGYVWESVRTLLEDPRRMMEEWARRAATDRLRVELKTQVDNASKTLKTHEKSLQRLLDAYEAGAMELDELTARAGRIKLRMQRARQDLAATEQKLAETVTLQSIITRLDDFAARVKGGLEHLDWLQKRQLIRTLVARVEIDEEGATVVYRLPSLEPPTSPGSSGESDKPGELASAGESIPLCGRRDFAPVGERLPALRLRPLGPTMAPQGTRRGHRRALL